jgi:hypothetical protein
MVKNFKSWNCIYHFQNFSDKSIQINFSKNRVTTHININPIKKLPAKILLFFTPYHSFIHSLNY